MDRFVATWLARSASALALCTVACSLVIGDLPQGVDKKPSSTGGVSGQAGGGSAGQASGGGAGQASGGAAGSGGTGGVAGSAASGGAAGSGGTSACKKPPCDCDGDGHDGSAGACSGDDCDDGDPDAYPGQAAYFDHPRVSGGFDFNCNNLTDPEYSTALDCGLGVALCPPPTQQGFIKPMPACGQPGNWGYCTVSGIQCQPQVTEPTKKMTCH